MNGYGHYPPPSASSAYSPMPPIEQAKPYLQSPVQDPDLLPDSGRYGQNGSSNQTPPSDALLRGYSANNSIEMNGLGISGIGHRPATPRMSNQLDFGDPVALHLLVETALGDSETYHVLSFDEVDRTKKELDNLSPHIEGVRKKLALESKVRDAALSLNRLYRRESANSPSSKRRTSGSGPAKRDSISKTEDEVATSNKKCADLARELYGLETRQRELQTRLLMHTAGVLQMTHRGPTEKRKLSEFGNSAHSMANGANGTRPDSPESIYTYENGRMDRALNRSGRDEFDERSLYRTPDEMYGFSFDGSTKTERSMATEKQFSELGARLEELNSRLREAIMQANVVQPVSPLDASQEGETASIASLTRQLDNVERNMHVFGKAQVAQLQQQQQLEYALEQHRQQADEALQKKDAEHENVLRQRDVELQNLQQNSASAIGGDVLSKLQHFNKQLYGLLNAAAADGFKRQETPSPPSFEVDDANAEMEYMERAVTAFSNVIREMLQYTESAKDREGRDAHERGKAEQMETVLGGLWTIMLAGEEDARQRRKAMGQPDDIPFDANEPFNLPSFSKKVQWLVTQSTDLRSKAEEFAAVTTQHEAVERELETHRGHADRANTLEQQLAAKAAEFATLEAALQASRDTTAERQNTLQTLRQQLIEKDNQVQARDAEIATARAGSQKDVEDLENKLVTLTTELTMAKAELDAAYGSRAERQKEANGESQRALEEAQARITELETATAAAQSGSQREKQMEDELRSTLQEFEELTKASVDSEKERDKLEAIVDQLRDKVEETEAALSAEKVRWLGVRSPGANGESELTSVSTMRNDFKRMMRETRLEGVKALRVSCSQCNYTRCCVLTMV